eukprot:360653-Alexandrium_andersonii.AAC.1
MTAPSSLPDVLVPASVLHLVSLMQLPFLAVVHKAQAVISEAFLLAVEKVRPWCGAPSARQRPS